MKNLELIKSMQNRASTLASERVSISSKLKESKMSATSLSTNGYESGTTSRGQKTTSRSSTHHPLKTESESKIHELSNNKGLLNSNGLEINVASENSTPVIKASLLECEENIDLKAYNRNFNFYPN
jgi:hypothetical protein